MPPYQRRSIYRSFRTDCTMADDNEGLNRTLTPNERDWRWALRDREQDARNIEREREWREKMRHGN